MLEKQRNELKAVPSSKPLFKKLEEEFENKMILIEETKKIEQEERKKNLFQPLNHEEIIKHSKQHSLILNDLKRTHKKIESLHEYQSLSSHKLHEFLENQKKDKQKFQESIKEKKLLLDKRNQYGKLIMEVHQPSIDSLKRQELELIKERLSIPVRKRIKSMTPSLQNVGEKRSYKQKSARTELNDSTSSSQNNSKIKISTNPMYLEERRKLKERLAKEMNHKASKSYEYLNKDYLENRLDNAKDIEMKAVRHGNLIKYLDPLNLSGLEAEEKINSMLIESVKAKLSKLS